MTRRALALAVLVVGAVAIVVGVVQLLGADDPAPPAGGRALSDVLDTATPASAPFEGLTELHVGVGGRCLRVAVADSLMERAEGLRERSDLGPYDGMLFLFGVPTRIGFTMSMVPVPLEIGFYGGDGARNSTRHMKPCPRAEAQCPVYEAAGPFVYALETLKGKLPAGALAACS
ncbi:MAG TPA: DUF192 domain-containing protein [Acidimicrobiia bacterium]